MSDSRGVCSHAVGRDHYHRHVEVHVAEWSKPCVVEPGFEPRADTAHAPGHTERIPQGRSEKSSILHYSLRERWILAEQKA